MYFFSVLQYKQRGHRNMPTHPKDKRQRNPRFQCSVCGKWMRQFKNDGTMTAFGGCQFTNGDHAAGDGIDVCHKCCFVACSRKAAEKQKKGLL